jgi:hypothetical protein
MSLTLACLQCLFAYFFGLKQRYDVLIVCNKLRCSLITPFLEAKKKNTQQSEGSRLLV